MAISEICFPVLFYTHRHILTILNLKLQSPLGSASNVNKNVQGTEEPEHYKCDHICAWNKANHLINLVTRRNAERGEPFHLFTFLCNLSWYGGRGGGGGVLIENTLNKVCLEDFFKLNFFYIFLSGKVKMAKRIHEHVICKYVYREVTCFQAILDFFQFNTWFCLMKHLRNSPPGIEITNLR